MKSLTPEFNTWVAEKVYEALTSPDSTKDICYVVQSDVTSSWNNGLLEPLNTDTVMHREVPRKVILGKRVYPQNVSLVARRVNFVPGKVYQMYDDTVDLRDQDFFACVHDGGGYHSVWKCLYNNNGMPAKVAPRYTPTVDREQSQTSSDGYIWKFLFRVTPDDMRTFSTNKYLPVRPNANVASRATSGSISVIKVEDSGQYYNSYAYGFIKQSQVSGDNLIYSLGADDYTNLMTLTIKDSIDTFNDIDPIVLYNGAQPFTVDGVISSFTVYETDGTTYLRLAVMNNTQLPVIDRVAQHTAGVPFTTASIIAQANISTIAMNNTPLISANTDFYKNCSIYIRSGKGAGQLRTVSEYIVTGNERRVVLNRPFNIIPDTASRFEILPRVIVQGDGTSSDGTGMATAIPVIDPVSNSINSIQMIDIGRGYTYASVSIVSNTGYVDVTTGDIINPNPAVVKPVIAPKGGHGSNVLSELYTDSVVIHHNFDGSEGGRLPVGNDFGEVILVKDVEFNRIELEISSPASIFSMDSMILQSDGAAEGRVFNRNGNILTLDRAKGEFKEGMVISSTTTPPVVSTIVNVIDSMDTFNNTYRMATEVTSSGLDGTGFQPDDIVIQGSTDILNSWAQGVIYSANSTMVSITNVTGVWNSSDTTSGTVNTVYNTRNGATATINGIIQGDVSDSMTLLYRTTLNPVTRAEGQSETVKIVLSAKDLLDL